MSSSFRCFGFVLPVQVSSPSTPPVSMPVLASTKTRRRMNTGTSSVGLQADDPWAHGQDPWAKFRSNNPAAPKATAGAAAKIKEVHEQLKHEVDEAVQTSLAERKRLDTATEDRFRRLETDLTELKAQGQKFENWFGKRMDTSAMEVGAIKQALQGQQHELSQLQGQVAAQTEMVQSTVSQAVVTMRMT